MKAGAERIVLAYSGGLDTSVMIHWLKQRYGGEVIAGIVDVGQNEDLAQIRKKALANGASSAYVLDARREFVLDYLWPMLAAGAVYEGRYHLGTAIARPLIAKKIIALARQVKAGAVAHGATGKGNDQVRFELTFRVLAPDLKVIAPWREWELRSRSDEVEYARRHRLHVPTTPEKPYSSDANLWHISYEGGILEDPARPPDENMFQMTRNPATAAAKGEAVEIGFRQGRPVSVNGRRMDPVRLVQALNRIAGRHGVGRTDMVENRLVGIKSRGVYESPAAACLHFSHRELESLCLDRDTFHFKEQLAPRYAELVYYGLWETPLRRALDAFVRETQKNVTGRIRLRLRRGTISVEGRQAERSLYRRALASFEEDRIYDQKDAGGFISIFSLPYRVTSLK